MAGRVLVVGSVAYDTVETPAGKRERMLGGSAVYFSLAARLFSPVALSGVVGSDFAPGDRGLLSSLGVDLTCLETAEDEETFRWHGRYHEDMNRRDTISVELNAFEDFRPDLPEEYRKFPFVFLANGSTATQLALLEQVRPFGPVVYFDTMDLWIETERDGVVELLRNTDGIILNDGEALLLSGASNVVEAGRKLMDMGASNVIIKKGEHGVMAFRETGSVICLPAFPTGKVADPTGAGDSFAGAFMGRLAASGGGEGDGFREALSAASVTASFCVEDFGVEGLVSLDEAAVEERLAEFREMARPG